jgi:hypothetical protein
VAREVATGLCVAVGLPVTAVRVDVGANVELGRAVDVRVTLGAAVIDAEAVGMRVSEGVGITGVGVPPQGSL